MDRISQIIREEIEKLIINENISSLSQFSVNLNNSLNKLGNDLSKLGANGLNQQLQQFFKNFETYVIQMIFAINRCVKANSLNEGLSDFGINVPAELGGNFWNDAKRGYYKTMNFLTRGGGNYNGKNGNMVNPNTVPSVKLSQLLQNLPNIENSYNSYKSNVDQISQQPMYMIATMRQVQTTYSQLLQTQQNQNMQPQQNQNAQGQQP